MNKSMYVYISLMKVNYDDIVLIMKFSSIDSIYNISITMIKALVCAYLSLTLAHCLFTIECFTSLFTITLLYTKQYVSISFFFFS